MTNQKFKINKFYELAEKYRLEITDEAELKKINRTELFYKELNYMVEHGEIIIININAKMRLGKSTVAMSIGHTIYDMLKFHKQKPKNSKFGIMNIARDQQEYSKLMRNPKLNFNVIVTDEDNELERTGENSSTEEALNKVFSDVQAGRYVHRICCSPKEMSDPNADLLLNVISMNKKTMTNHCHLYYRYYEGGIERTQLIGYVNVYVGNVIHNWVTNIQPLHKKELLGKITEKEKEILKKAKKEDFYVEYYLKKHEKMDLLTKEGIFRPRMLDNAEIYLKIIRQLRSLASLQGVINSTVIRSFVKMEFKAEKIPMSIIGERNATDDVSAVLNLYTSREKVQKEINNIEKKAQTGKVNPIVGAEQQEKLVEMRKSLDLAIKVQMNELEHNAEIAKKYNQNGDDLYGRERSTRNT